MVVVSIFSIVFALVVGVIQTLDMHPNIVPMRAILFAVIFFALPVVVVVLVSADSAWGRFAACTFLLGAASFYAFVDKSIPEFPDRDHTVASLALLASMLLSVWSYQSSKLRHYVRYIRSDAQVVLVRRNTDVSEGTQEKRAPHLGLPIDAFEFAAIVVVMALVAGAFLHIGIGW
ncbi:MAG: hypothetical protein AAF004_16340 [Pseudomonadota bacterium]